MYTPFDINEAIGHRKDYVEAGLRSGSPVVGVRCDEGLLLVTVRRSQRKVYEIYDRQMFSAIGRQSDIENVRLSAIQTAHQEGFERSPDDVSLQRLVGFALSPALKKAFGDQMYVPVVIRALFAELGRTGGADCFFSLNYDGEYRQHTGIAVIAGSQRAEDRMLEVLGEPDASLTRDEAIRRALRAWVAGARDQIGTNVEEDGDLDNPLRMVDEADADRVFLQDELKSGSLEVGFLQRRDKQDARFHLLTGDVLEKVISELY